MSNQVEQLEMKPAAKGSALSNSPVGKIIVVDDEPELKNILVEALSAQGFEVTGCSSGQQALEALRQKEFDLLLTDLMMPEMDGIALLEAAVKVDPYLIGIMMTGQGTIQTAVDAMKVGAFDYVLKPFRLQTVLPVLTRAINTRRLRMENLQLRETVAIYSLCQTIAFTLDAQTVLSKLADAALQQSDADEVSILLPTSDGKELFVAAVRGEKRERLLGERVPLQESISSWVARERMPLILNGEVHDERFVALWPRPEIRSAVSVPMQVANKLVGIINLNVTNRLRPFTLGQMKALTILASTAAVALESASLYTQVRTTEEKYRSIFENATEGLFQSTSDGRVLTANPALARILGYDSPEEMIATVTDLAQQLYVNPEDRAEAARLQEEAGGLVGFEMEAYRKDGEKLWLSLNRRSVRNQNGELLHFEGSVEDITARRHVEEEKRKTRQQYESLVHTIDGIVWELDVRTFTFTFVSKQSERLLGYTPEQWLSDPGFWKDHLHPDDRSWALEFCRVATAKKEDHEFDYRMIAADGRVVWLRDLVTVDYTNPDLPNLRGVMVDITERKLAEDQLKKSEERYRDLVENAHDLIYEHDLEGNYISANKAVEQITGYSLEESFHLNLAQVVAPDYLEKSQEMVRRKLAGERVTAYELEIIAKGGHRVAIEVNTSLVLRDGVPVGIRGIARDITERKRAEAERLVIFEIIQGSITTPNLDEFLKLIHKSIGKLLYAENCFVGLYDETTKLMHFEYWADQFDPVPLPRTPGKGFSSYVLRTNQPLLLTEELKSRMYGSGEVEKAGRSSASWLGVPLRMSSRAMGVLVVQHYEDKHAYSQRDLEFLSSVGDQIALAIERKRGEEALRESEERYRDLVENAHDLIYEHDLEGNYVSANKEIEQITGYSLEESIHLNLAKIVAPDYQEKSQEMFRRKLAGERVTAYELEIIAKDGHRVAVEVNSSLVLRDGVPVGVRGIIRDITERKLAEEGLRESEERYRLLFESNPQPMWVYDLETLAFLAVNESAVHNYGYSREDFLAMTIKDIRPAEDIPALYDSVAGSSEGVDAAGIWRHLKKDGTIIEVEITSHLLVFDDRRAELILAHDITERNRLEAALLASEEQLRQSQKLEAIGQLAGGVAHDFNNLLTAINGYSALALRRLGEEHPIASYLEEIKKAGDRAANLTRQLLAFGRKQLLQPLSLNLNGVVTDMSKMLKRLIGEDIDFVAKLSSDLKQIKADPGQVEQVLVNLVVNARDSMPSGGTLTIETANAQLDGAYASNHVGVTPGSYIMLAVSDTGIGMDQETQARIFEPFFTTKEKGKGTGLGLSTVYGIVKQSGGNVWVYSELKRGTTFKVYLPQLEDEVEVDGAPAVVSNIKRGSETVLLVEDEDMVRNLAAALLKENGYNVLEASGGEAAIRLCQKHIEPIHLLITDVVMPKMSGKDVAHQLQMVHPETKVLFMSGYTDEAIVHHGIVDSHIAFIQKPFSETALTQKIRDVLDAVNGQK